MSNDATITKARKRTPSTTPIDATGRGRHPFLGVCLALCSMSAAAQSVPTPHGLSAFSPGAAPALAGHAVIHSFEFFNSAEGHGPFAAMAVDKRIADRLIGASFFGGSAARRCNCVLGGVVFSMTPDGAAMPLHAFTGPDGIGPNGQLVQGEDGLWYGLTLGGGAYGHGTAYRLAGDGTGFEVLHSFGGSPTEGSQPSPGPLAPAADGSFYGTTSRGGSAGMGTLFRMTPDGTVSTLHDFAGSPEDGWDPQDQPVVDAEGNVYGTTTCGGDPEDGAHCGGTLYRRSRSGAYEVLHAFRSREGGYHPLSAPTRVGQSLFGTTSAGGNGDFGVLYRIGVHGSSFETLHDFGGGLVASPPNDDGARPVGRLLLASDARLYGTTSNGGPNPRMFPAGDGTLFRIDPTGNYELLDTLGGKAGDAAHPVAALVEGRDGTLYGTSDDGGLFQSGTVFRFQLGAERAIASAPTAVAAGAQAQKVPAMVEYSKAWSLVVADFDGDGIDDILIAGHDQEDRIWYGSPTGYRPGPQPLPWRDRHGCAAADVDRDGRIDLFCAIGAEGGTGKAQNELWHQQPDGIFVSVADFGAEDPYGRGRKPVFLDFDRKDGPDLYIANDHLPRKDGRDNVNRMYVNRGDGTFYEVDTLATGVPGHSGEPGDQCAIRGDIDGDGWDDLVVCKHEGPARIFINDQENNFRMLVSASTEIDWRDARLVDMDADGREDLVVVTKESRLRIWLNTGQYPYFLPQPIDLALPAAGESLTTGDFDGDGRRDVYVVLHGDCAAGEDDAPDALFLQRSPGVWSMERLDQAFGGCGHLVASIGGSKVLLANGTDKAPGPNYVLKFATKAK